MAEARKTEVERIVKEEGALLELTMPELRTVYSALLRMGGLADRSPRGHADRVRKAIEKAVAVDPLGAPVYDRDPWSWANPEWACLRDGPGLVAKNYPVGEGE